MAFAASLAWLLAATLVLAEAAARIGAGLLPWLGRPERGPLERCGFGVLLGWSAVGIAYLGLGLTGLFAPVPLVLAAAALLAGSRAARSGRPLVLDAIREAAALGPGPAVAALLTLPVLVFLVAPEAGWDGYVYHLGAPWQFLQVHRAVFAHVPTGYQLSLPVEMTFAIPLMVGDERLARGIVGTFVAAAAAVHWAWCRREDRRIAAWLGPLLFLAAGETLSLATECKNDLAASALVVAGALVFRDGRRPLGSLLLGLGIAAKPVYGPLAVLWAGAHLGRRPPLVAVAAGLGVPSLPWWAKSALHAAGPGFPTAWFTTKVYWVKATVAAGGASYPETWIARTVPMLGWSSLAQVPASWLGIMARDHLGVGLFLVGAWLATRDRRGIAVSLAAQAILLAIVDVPRFLVAAQWLLALDVADALPGLPGRFRILGPRLAAAAAVLHLVTLPGLDRADAAGAFARGAEAPGARYGTYLDAARAAAALPGRRVLLVGEPRSYHIAGRAIFEGTLGETPWIWAAVHDARTPDDLNRRWRQLGASTMVYNFVAANYHLRGGDRFPWTPRMISLYAEFLRRHLAVRRAPPAVDRTHGGYYLYAWSRRPAARPVPPLYLPGAEDAFGPAASLVQQGDYAGAAAALDRVAVDAPDVAHLDSLRGDLEWIRGAPQAALRAYRRAAAAGLVDVENWTMLGDVAQATSRFAESAAAYARADALYPDRRATIDPKLATLEFRTAEGARAAGRAAEAETAYRRCLEALGRLPASRDRDTSRAFALIRLAGIQVRLRRPVEARLSLREAFEVLPEARRNPEAVALARQLGR